VTGKRLPHCLPLAAVALEYSTARKPERGCGDFDATDAG
jgi:hypothetical protein